ncbi:Gfo/Idh/MocA family protein [Neptunitalea lumnitzerae]|uniref:Oxidoreductase n=1 Tax=Neptunitalea lumnitzerae TaxID=2965509 RepID=A0ABQ5MKH0_9FLAO|nr:Gfo/Idh/MocA family oxidoreductase [Neptunitalea sp. Y10]GLB49550.1 oxidoreductase [Neptunitalea sp. Y10]
MSSKINWAILGTGKIARKFATDLKVVPNTVMYAVGSRTKESAERFSKEFNFENSYGSYEALINDENIDAIYIASPHAYHFEHTKMCLEKGIAVLCEKPFAMNSNQVQEMIALAREKDVLLMEALWTHFLPHYQFVMDFTQKKTFGKIKSMKADFGFFREFSNDDRVFNKSLGGGSLLDIGIYPIFAALTLLGLPDGIKASATFFDNGADATCSMEFSYANNVKAFLESSLIEETPTEAIIEYEKGTVHILRKFHEPSKVKLIDANGTVEIKDFNYTTIGYNYETAHFTELLLNGAKESPLMNFDKSLKIIGLLDKVRELIGLEY